MAQEISEEITEVPAYVRLTPIAAPSVLGLYGFAGATFVVAAYMAQWYGNGTSPSYFFEFAAFFGGLAQFMAGMWSYRARDAAATAMHGMWGSFWMAYGLLFLLETVGLVQLPSGEFPGFGYWFIALAAITWVGMVAAFANNAAVVVVLGLLAAGSSVAAPGFIMGNDNLIQAAGWIFIFSAISAWYTASAIMLEEAFSRTILPIWPFQPAKDRPELSAGLGEPGVIHGQ